MKTVLHWSHKLNDAFWRRVVRATTVDVRSLCIFRIFLGLGLLFFYFPTFSWISGVPHAWFNPPLFSIAHLIGAFPPGGFFVALDLLLLTALVCITIGLHARLATLVYVAGSLFGLSFKYSFGKIEHDILVYLLLICLAFSGWDSQLAMRPAGPPTKAATERSLSLIAVVICFAFFSAGCEKSLHWIDFDVNTSGFGSWFYISYYKLDRRFLLAPFFSAVPFRYLEVLDYSAVVLELTPLLFLLHSRRAWRMWLLVACVFHLMNAMLLNIPVFIANIPVYLVFIDYTRQYENVKRLFQKDRFRMVFFFLLLIGVILRLRIIFQHQLAATVIVPDSFLFVYLCIGVVLWTIAITAVGYAVLKKASVNKTQSHY